MRTLHSEISWGGGQENESFSWVLKSVITEKMRILHGTQEKHLCGLRKTYIPASKLQPISKQPFLGT